MRQGSELAELSVVCFKNEGHQQSAGRPRDGLGKTCTIQADVVVTHWSPVQGRLAPLEPVRPKGREWWAPL